jgi:DNA-binding XRE family transcriptional regulator
MRRGITQEKAGKSLGVSRRVVAAWETNGTPVPKMVDLAIWAIEQGQSLGIADKTSLPASQRKRVR